MGERRGVEGERLADARGGMRARRRRGFTLVELTVVGVTLALLACILYPVFARAREKAHTARCQTYLRQIWVALQVYAQDHHGRFPPRPYDLSVLLPYLREPEVLSCPSARLGTGYWYGGGLACDSPPRRPLVGDSAPRHNGGGNILFVEGHVKWYKAGLMVEMKRPPFRGGPKWLWRLPSPSDGGEAK